MAIEGVPVAIATKFTFFTADLHSLRKGLLYRARIGYSLRHGCQLSVSFTFVPKKIGPHHNCHNGVKNPCLYKCVMLQ